MTAGAALPSGAIDVWWIDRARAVSSTAAADLSQAAAIGQAARRDRFLTGRGALRQILGVYLAMPAESVPLVLGPHGKPALRGGFGLAFNLSHAGTWSVVAVMAADAVGVDAAVNEDLDATDPAAWAPIATPAEAAALAALAPGPAAAARRRLWVRKEALGKALGGGVLAPLAAMEIGLAPCPAPVATPSGDVFVSDCEAPAGVTAAVCATAPLEEIRIRRAALPPS